MSSTTHMGLLQRANLLSQKKGLAFCEFIQKNNISKAAIFYLIDNNYYIQNSIGFDGTSLLSSKSTVDFWNGFLSEKSKIYNYTKDDENINSILQFFSFNLKDTIETVKLVRTGDKIYLLCNSDISDSVFTDFYSIDKSYPQIDFTSINLIKDTILRNFIINIQPAVTSLISNKNLDVNIFEKAISNEICNRLYFLFSENSFFSLEDKSIKISINSTVELSEKALLTHIINTVKDILEDSTSLISVISSGKSESIAELKNFLKAE